MTGTIEKFLIPLGSQWLLKVFTPDGHLTVTLDRVDPAETEGELLVTRIDCSPHPEPTRWFDEIDLPDLIADARWQAARQEEAPEYRAVRWQHQTRPGKPMSADLLTEVVKLRQTLTPGEIAQRLGRSRSQVFRYLQQAREQGITAAEEEDNGPR